MRMRTPDPGLKNGAPQSQSAGYPNKLLALVMVVVVVVVAVVVFIAALIATPV